MRDGPVRRGVKRLARMVFDANLLALRAWLRLRGEERFLLGGACRRCARCCEAPGIQVGRLVWYLRTTRHLFLWWQHHVNGFVHTGEDRATRTFVFACTHFDWTTRSCDSYESRPGICRDYPRVHLFQPAPETMPGCGYRPIAANARAMLKALADQNLSAEQLEKLKKGLYLE